MMKGIRLPGLDASRFSRIFVINRGRRGLAQFLNQIGPERLEKLVAEKKPLSDVLPPEQTAEYMKLAQQFHWIARLISDEDFYSMLPDWCLKIVLNHGPEGHQWLAEQVTWLRSLFTPPTS